MPLYLYRCKECQWEWEELAGIKDKPKCPECKGEALKLVARVGKPVIH